MEFSISKEATIFLYSALAGILICIVYDLFCAIRKKGGTGRMLTDIQDIIFWTIATVIMFFIVFYINNGQVRWYEFFGVLLGSLLYKCTVSHWIVFLLSLLIDTILKFFVIFFKILLTPLLFMYNIIFKCISIISTPIYRFLKNYLKRLKGKMTSGFRRAKTAAVKK